MTIEAALDTALDSARPLLEPTPHAALVLAAVHGDQTVTRTLGAADERFEWGSLTKAVTGLVVARLTLEGRLSLDAPLSGWVPDAAPAWLRDASIADLATHHSGLPRLAPMLLTDDVDPEDPYRDFGEAALTETLRELPTQPAEPAGTYSNLGYAVLGTILDAVEPGYATHAIETCRLLGMRDATFDDDGLVPGFDEDGLAARAWATNVHRAAGGLRGTGDDLLAWLAAACRRDPLTDAWRLAFDEHRPGRGLAWRVASTPAGRVAMHNGGTAGMRSLSIIGLDEPIAAGFLVSAAGAGDELESVTKRAFEALR